MNTIMVAEDNQINRDLVRAVVMRAYPEVTLIEAADGTQAIELFRRSRPGLVLMDLRMPGTDGFTAAAAIRRIEAEGPGTEPTKAGTEQAGQGSAGTEQTLAGTEQVAAGQGVPPARIIALTAGSPAAEEQACRRAGMDGVLAKPITPQGLRSVIGDNL